MSEGQVSKKQKAEEKKNTLDGVVCTPAGCSIAPVYKRLYDEELDRNIVKKVDETNITEFIQASRSQTDLAILQKRFIELGEIPAVDPNMQSGVDNTILPSDIHSLYNMVNDVNGNFNKLPESVRKVFGNPQAYLAAILDGSVNSKITDAFSQSKNTANETETNGEE